MPTPLPVDVRAGGVGVVTVGACLERLPDGLDATARDVEEALGRLGADPGVVGVVLRFDREHGERLSRAVLEATRGVALAADGERLARRLVRTCGLIRTFDKPVVAAIDGSALGFAFEVALASHEVLVSDDSSTRLGLNQVELGLAPFANGLLRVAERAGLRVALRLGVRGPALLGSEARRLGLVDAVISRPALLNAAAARVQSLAARTSRERSRSGTGPRLRLERLAVDKSRFGRAVLLRRTRRDVRVLAKGLYSAETRIVDGLARFARRGFAEAADLEARSFGELCVTERARRLVEVALAFAELGNPPAVDAAYVARIRCPYLEEARALTAEGVAPSRVAGALVAWGWPAGTLPGTIARSAEKTFGPAPEPPDEEIQMRCSLRLINEALRCLADGTLKSPRDGDVQAIVGAGFPRFRGGPFRYVDAVGPEEVRHRIEGYARRFGAGWSPAPALVEKARAGGRFYEG